MPCRDLRISGFSPGINNCEFSTNRAVPPYTAKLNGCFDLAVVILIVVLSDTQDAYQFRVEIGMLEVN